jgi:hypothetical protein
MTFRYLACVDKTINTRILPKNIIDEQPEGQPVSEKISVEIGVTHKQSIIPIKNICFLQNGNIAIRIPFKAQRKKEI